MAGVVLLALVSSACAWVSRVSVDSTGTQGDGASRDPAISADGRYIAFESDAANLVAGNTNGRGDGIVRANPQPDVTAVLPLALPRGATTAVMVTGSDFQAGAVLSVTGGGINVTNVTVVSPTEVTADVAVASGASIGTRNVLVRLPGTGPRAGLIDAWGLCTACVTVT